MSLDIEAMRRSAEAPELAGPADIAGVIQDLTDAFAVDPHFNWFLRDDERRTEARRRIFQFLIGGAGRTHGRIERPAGGGAAAVWMPFEWLAPTPFLQELRRSEERRVGKECRSRGVPDDGIRNEKR